MCNEEPLKTKTSSQYNKLQRKNSSDEKEIGNTVNRAVDNCM
jgi:hypothetical protein